MPRTAFEGEALQHLADLLRLAGDCGFFCVGSGLLDRLTDLTTALVPLWHAVGLLYTGGGNFNQGRAGFSHDLAAVARFFPRTRD